MSWLAETLVSSTLLMLVVLALRRPVAQAFGAHVAYALWALPALRLMLPPLPGWSTLYVPIAHRGPAEPLVLGIVDPATATRLVSDTAATASLPAVATASPAFDPLIDSETLLPLLIALWSVGVVTWFGWQMLRYRRFLRQALAVATPLARVAGVEVLVTPAVAGPMAAGIRHRRILLPADFNSRYTPEERRLALLHEAAHHDRRDLAANLAGLAVVAVHWWNPVAHWAYRAFRRDQELACDASVLAGSSAETRAIYGSAVLKSACLRTPAAACAMNHKSQLKQRIAMMKTQYNGTRVVAGGVFATVLIGSGLLLSASGIAAVPPVPPVPPVAAIAPAVPVAPLAPLSAETPPSPPSPVSPPSPPAPVAPRPPRYSAENVVIRDGKLSAADEKAIRQAERDARRAGERARVAGERAGRAAEAQAAAMVKALDIDATVQRALASARAGMMARCTAAGVTMPAAADMGDLAICDRKFDASIRETVRESLKAARQQIATSLRLSDDARRAALEGIDDAIRDNDSEARTPTI
jgi:beta-lactamase regulating signal transducer with metallopeptidase domain